MIRNSGGSQVLALTTAPLLAPLEEIDTPLGRLGPILAAQDRETSYLVQIANLDKRRNERFFSLSEDLTPGVI